MPREVCVLGTPSSLVPSQSVFILIAFYRKVIIIIIPPPPPPPPTHTHKHTHTHTHTHAACVASRPGQSGRCDGYLLKGKELEFYLKKMKPKKNQIELGGGEFCDDWLSSIYQCSLILMRILPNSHLLH